ncbi:MAG TPA: hypothetical protein VGC05_11230 [Mycobacterium sp.]
MPEPPDDLLWTTTDTKGRTVVLTQERLDHIHDGHREVRAENIKKAVEAAEKRTKGNRPHREKLWARNLPPAKWFTVVVAYEGRVGKVITALGVSKDPKSEELL